MYHGRDPLADSLRRSGPVFRSCLSHLAAYEARNLSDAGFRCYYVRAFFKITLGFIFHGPTTIRCTSKLAAEAPGPRLVARENDCKATPSASEEEYRGLLQTFVPLSVSAVQEAQLINNDIHNENMAFGQTDS